MGKAARGWTVDILHEHIKALLDERDVRYTQESKALAAANRLAVDVAQRAIDAALQSQREAAGILETHAREWRNASNEWREAMSDRERNFVPREVFDALSVKVANLEAQVNAFIIAAGARGEGKKETWGLMQALLAVAVALLSMAATYVALR